ncbi:interleukin-18 receptor accessory protein-like [Thalassophryne amazonica]|uniref:interleukin-18 receptor accessory protein-like n=1 Tax=Thalassophryne amazonica TaxID=390379 RepID=UPI001472574D|nr:interleukin-18 receptor accessory protein-like [Thalassophryne amazonica]
MQTAYVLFYLIFPISSEGCCVGKQKGHKERMDFPQDLALADQHYRAVEGEAFMMQCVSSLKRQVEVVWSRTAGDSEGNKSGERGTRTDVISRHNDLHFQIVEAKHSGNYTCTTGDRKVFFYLQVVEKLSLRCIKPEESTVTLIMSTGGTLTCPRLTCSDRANTDINWYKGNRSVSELQRNRDICENNGLLHLCHIYKTDSAVYYCDRRTREQGLIWTIRRAVTVTVIPQNARDSPRIIHPDDNKTEEVELGHSHTLVCEVFFHFERHLSLEVQWYMNKHSKVDERTPLEMDSQQQEKLSFAEFLVRRTATIKEVTLLHLNHTYTCTASNSVGNSTATIKFKRKTKVKWPMLIGYPIASLLLVAGLGIVLHVKWLEVTLMYRSHCQGYAKPGEDDKEFDVFVSCVWSRPTPEVSVGLTTPLTSRGGTDEEARLASINRVNSEDRDVSQWPLEALLPRVLEGQWGYRICLLERDMLPGGAYTNDVVQVIHRSRMLICLLSAEYFSNSNAVFVLQSGIQSLLQTSNFKLLLIWTGRSSTSLVQYDPPLPPLVLKALKVLPSLDWPSDQAGRATRTFWRSLRKTMPVQRK